MPPWSVPFADLVLSEDDLAAVTDVYRSGWLTMGPQTAALEAAIAKLVGARHAIATANGTAALHLACVAAGLGPGDDVLMPSLTFVATANAVTYTGARPVFADIAATHRPWPGSAELEAVLTPRTKAIVAVPYAGETEPSSGVIEFAAEHGLTLIEDAAHALGATVGGRHVGTFGQVGAYSLFSNKPLATGEGGLVVTQRPDWAERMRLLRSHGVSRSTWERHHASAPSYDVLAVGFNYRIDEPRAALALSRLRRLESDRLARTRLVDRYRGGLEGLEQVVPVIGSGTAGASTHHLFPVLVAEGVDRDGLRARLAEEGIQTSLHYPPVHRTSAYGRLSARLPRTEDYARRTLTLPLFAHLTHHQQDMVLDVLRRCA